jgi:hypothetical protein
LLCRPIVADITVPGLGARRLELAAWSVDAAFVRFPPPYRELARQCARARAATVPWISDSRFTRRQRRDRQRHALLLIYGPARRACLPRTITMPRTYAHTPSALATHTRCAIGRWACFYLLTYCSAPSAMIHATLRLGVDPIGENEISRPSSAACRSCVPPTYGHAPTLHTPPCPFCATMRAARLRLQMASPFL